MGRKKKNNSRKMTFEDEGDRSSIVNLGLRPEIFRYERSDDDFDMWLKRFERIARVNRWKEEDKVDILGCYLDGKALEIYENVPEEVKQDYRELSSCLLSKFKCTGHEKFYLNELMNKFQTDSESVEEYSVTVLKLVKRAYSTLSTSSQDKIAVSHFTRGLLPEIRKVVVRADCSLLEEATTTAVKEESCLKLEGKTTINQSLEEKKIDEMFRRIEELEQRLDKKNLITEASHFSIMHRNEGSKVFAISCNETEHKEQLPCRGISAEGGGRVEVVCSKCGTPGHIQYNCQQNHESVNGQSEESVMDHGKNTPRTLPDIGPQQSGIYVKGTLNSKEVTMLTDTGASVTLIGEGLSRELGLCLTEWEKSAVLADGQPLHVLGTANVVVQIKDLKVIQKVLVARNLTTSCILGLDFLATHKMSVDLQQGRLTWNSGHMGSTVLEVVGECVEPVVCRVLCKERSVRSDLVPYDGRKGLTNKLSHLYHGPVKIKQEC